MRRRVQRAMGLSDKWHELAKDFRALDCSGTRLGWQEHPQEPRIRFFLYSDGDAHAQSNRTQFDALCVSAGALSNPDTDDPYHHWMLKLQKEAPNDIPGKHQVRDAAGIEREYPTGHIRNVCLASATLCSREEGIAKKRELESERSRRQQAESGPRTAVEELHALGLTIEMSEEVAQHIVGEMEIIAGRDQQGFYSGNVYQPFYDAYRAIASAVVSWATPDEVLETMIPKVLDSYRTIYRWARHLTSYECRAALNGPITEWKGRRRQAGATTARSLPFEKSPPHTSQATSPLPVPEDTLAPVTPTDLARKKDRPSMITSPAAVSRVTKFLDSHPHIDLTTFAGSASTTDRTLRTIRRTARARRDTWAGIAKALSITLEDLFKE